MNVGVGNGSTGIKKEGKRETSSEVSNRIFDIWLILVLACSLDSVQFSIEGVQSRGSSKR